VSSTPPPPPQEPPRPDEQTEPEDASKPADDRIAPGPSFEPTRVSPIPDFASGPPQEAADSPPPAPAEPTQESPSPPAEPTDVPPSKGGPADPDTPGLAVEVTRMPDIPDFSSGPPPGATEAPASSQDTARDLPAPPPASPEAPTSLWVDRATEEAPPPPPAEGPPPGPKPASVPLMPPPPDPAARRSDLRATQSPPDPSEVARAIAAAAQAMHREGLVVATTGNVSARDGELIVRITPTGLPYEEMMAEDVVTLERSGWHSPRGREPSSEYRMHLAIYRAREDVHAIVHTHSAHATAWSFLGEELTTGTEDLEHYVGGAVRTSRYEPTGTDEIGEAAVEALGDRRAALLARHGVVGVGETLQQALDAARVVERQAQIAWLLRS